LKDFSKDQIRWSPMGSLAGSAGANNSSAKSGKSGSSD
jgi:hypothetical protein